MSLHVLIIDDEPLALRVLATHTQKVDFLSLAGTTTNPVEGLLRIQQGGIDLVLLDVQMPAMTGLQFLQILQGQCPVILTTAYPQYALDGYEYAVVDYLLKPISFERFLKAVQRVQARAAAPHPLSPEAVTLPGAAAPPQPGADYLFIKTDSRLVKVSYADIYYVEGGREYTTVVTRTGKLLTLTSLLKLAESLPAPQFLRVHKSYLVALDKVEVVERQRLYLRQAVIPIGDTYRARFAQVLGER